MRPLRAGRTKLETSHKTFTVPVTGLPQLGIRLQHIACFFDSVSWIFKSQSASHARDMSRMAIDEVSACQARSQQQ
jgi:hypothetical protein